MLFVNKIMIFYKYQLKTEISNKNSKEYVKISYFSESFAYFKIKHKKISV